MPNPSEFSISSIPALLKGHIYLSQHAKSIESNIHPEKVLHMNNKKILKIMDLCHNKRIMGAFYVK